MRLIDADRLLSPGYTDMFDEPIEFDSVSRFAIEIQPTVEAIPVEWIKQWEKENWEMECNYGIDMMIEDWEKENEI